MSVKRIGAKTTTTAAAAKVPETYLAGKAVSLSRIVSLAKKYSLPTRPYPPLSLKAGTSFRIVLPKTVTAARLADVNVSNSPISWKRETRGDHLELTVTAKAPWRMTRQMDVVTLVWTADGKTNRVALGIAGLPDAPKG